MYKETISDGEHHVRAKAEAQNGQWMAMQEEKENHMGRTEVSDVAVPEVNPVGTETTTSSVARCNRRYRNNPWL
jgi:hypothetical protein